MKNEFNYYDSIVLVEKRYKNGDKEVKIFPNKDDIKFIASRMSDEQYIEALEVISEEYGSKMKLN